MSVLCIGEMLIDFTPCNGLKHTYTANPGGAPANVAVSVARNGVRSGFLGKMGNDDFGRLLISVLKENGVEIVLPDLSDEAVTTLAFVSLDEKGDRSFTFARKPGADMLLNESEVEKVDFDRWDMIHAGSVSQSGKPEREAVILAIRKAKEKGKLISFDINFRDKIWNFEDCKKEVTRIFPYVDLLKLSDEELDFVGGRDNIPSFMREYGISVVVLTLGGEGSVIFYKEEEIAIEAMTGNCVDTTGAGDAYWGGFISSLLRQGIKSISELDSNKLKTAGRYGAISGGLCVQKHGGIPALPDLQEIEAAKLLFTGGM